MRTMSSDAKADADQASPSTSHGRKRSSDQTEAKAAEPKPKQARKGRRTSASQAEASTSSGQTQKPRLTTPDLEFDFDRDQLRDPRPTPGRVKRPRYGDHELTQEFKQRFHIPKPRPRDFEHEALADPSATFHDLHVCHKKGPKGSPTYDSAGFQLDYNKVAKWMKPVAYNKKRMVSGMERHLVEQAKEDEKMIKSFFVDGKHPGKYKGGKFMDFLKDHVSKDLGVPWHQIDSKCVKEWEEKGFEKINADEWWHEPNEVERKRFMKMLEGASLRKDL
ncbi:hypothetical protein NCS55_01413300 [Fusarium keratoplasticum]|nr:hypothetical protein NCS55_01413300 [Fusarium keratoplasticum]